MKIVSNFLMLLLVFSFDAAFSAPAEEDGKNYFMVHGFNLVHERGLAGGEEYSVAFIESGANFTDLPKDLQAMFPEGKVILFDAGHAPHLYQALSTYVGKSFSTCQGVVERITSFLNDHNTYGHGALARDHPLQVVALYNGLPREGFPGGVVPRGRGCVYNYSRFSTGMDARGSSIFSWRDIEEKKRLGFFEEGKMAEIRARIQESFDKKIK